MMTENEAIRVMEDFSRRAQAWLGKDGHAGEGLELLGEAAKWTTAMTHGTSHHDRLSMDPPLPGGGFAFSSDADDGPEPPSVVDTLLQDPTADVYKLRIHERLSHLEDFVDAIHNQTGPLELQTNVADHEQKIGRLIKHFNEMSTRILAVRDDLQRQLSAVQRDVANVTNAIESEGPDLVPHELRTLYTNVETRLARIEGRLNEANDRHERLAYKVENDSETIHRELDRMGSAIRANQPV